MNCKRKLDEAKLTIVIFIPYSTSDSTSTLHKPYGFTEEESILSLQASNVFNFLIKDLRSQSYQLINLWTFPAQKQNNLFQTICFLFLVSSFCLYQFFVKGIERSSVDVAIFCYKWYRDGSGLVGLIPAHLNFSLDPVDSGRFSTGCSHGEIDKVLF
jgi:hypothetical protein